jgi:LPS O-antigen subunit length determinant protein (WzzB/FepE family)
MEQFHSNELNEFDGEIDLQEIFNIILQGKWIVISVTSFVSIIAVIYSLILPNIYESRALLAPVMGYSGMSAAIKNYGGLAGLAGINLPSDVDESNTTQAIEKIRTLSFFENNLLSNIFLQDLMAVKTWDPETNNLTYDETIYDTKSGTWVRDFSFPQQQIPSAQESFEVFTKQHINLSEDNKTGFITLSIQHQSPYIAKQWVELVVDEINNFYRQKDKLESQKAISYLNQQILMTGFSEIKDVLAQLVQEETKKLTLVEANQFYVFEYIEPPAVMEKKSGPRRALIFILSALLGGMLSIVTLLIRHYFIKKGL